MSKNDTVLLLTATVYPQSLSRLVLKDSLLRLDQYKRALRLWIQTSAFTKIVICENSNYPKNTFFNDEDAAFLDNSKIDLEYITFLPNSIESIQHYGKGFGEMEILEYALHHSLLIKSSNFVAKCTGRLFIKNISNILSDFYLQNNKNVNALANMSMQLNYCDSRFFMANKIFYEKYLFPLKKHLNDSKGVYFEKILARALMGFSADGMLWRVPLYAPNYQGHSASMGSEYKFPLNENISVLIKRKLLKW